MSCVFFKKRTTIKSNYPHLLPCYCAQSGSFGNKTSYRVIDIYNNILICGSQHQTAVSAIQRLYRHANKIWEGFKLIYFNVRDNPVSWFDQDELMRFAQQQGLVWMALSTRQKFNLLITMCQQHHVVLFIENADRLKPAQALQIQKLLLLSERLVLTCIEFERLADELKSALQQPFACQQLNFQDAKTRGFQPFMQLLIMLIAINMGWWELALLMASIQIFSMRGR